MVERDTQRQPLSAMELRHLLQGRPAIELFSRRSRRARELNVEPETLSDDELIDLLAREPGLLRRPVTQIGDQVLIGLDAERLRHLADAEKMR